MWSYFRPRRPLLRPHLVVVAEATWKNKPVNLALHTECLIEIKWGETTSNRNVWTPIIKINAFNSSLHVSTGEHYRETATAPAYDLVLAVRRRRLRYLGYVPRMPADRMVRCALIALVSDSVMYPTGSLFRDCQGVALPQLVAMAANRAMWRAKVASLSWTCVVLKWFLVLLLYRRTLGFTMNKCMYVCM